MANTAVKIVMNVAADRGRLALMHAMAKLRGDTFLGIGERSPVMQNGRLPGTPVRGYSTEYAKRLDLVRARFGSAL